MFARTDHQGSGDGETSKDEATSTFSVELLRNKQNEEHPKGQNSLGGWGFAMPYSMKQARK